MGKPFDFEKQVLEKSFRVPVAVQFSAEGCGPCIWLEKQMINVTKKMNGRIEFVSLPLIDYPEFETIYNINSNPTLLIFVNGQPAGTLKGALPDYALEQWINDRI